MATSLSLKNASRMLTWGTLFDMVDFNKALLDLFRADLLKHDWWYERADDSRAYAKGATEHKRLKDMAIAHGAEYQKIFNSVFAQLNPDAMYDPFPGLATTGDVGIPKTTNATDPMKPEILNMTVGAFIAAFLSFITGVAATPAAGGKAGKAAATPAKELEVDDGLGGDDDSLGAEEEEITLETIRELCGKVVKAGKKPKIKELMAKHKIASITEVPEPKLKSFAEGLKKLLPAE